VLYALSYMMFVAYDCNWATSASGMSRSFEVSRCSLHVYLHFVSMTV